MSRTFAVIGLGAFGSTVARDLADAGNDVIGIDRDDGPVSELADVLREAVIADARDEKALREAGLAACDTAVVAIGGDLEANIVSVVNAKLIGVEKVWAKALSRTHHRILARLGTDRVIHAEREMGQRVAQMLHNPVVLDYVSAGNGFYVVAVTVPDSLEGRTVASLELPRAYDVRCLEVMRGSDALLGGNGAASGAVLAEGDRMLVLGRRSALRTFAESF